MKQETAAKFAEILAAAQGKTQPTKQQPAAPKQRTAAKKQQPAPIPTPQPEPQPEQPVKLAKMESFTIIWHEGTGEFDNKTFTTWDKANDAMRKIYRSHKGAGYTKAKVCVKWENGLEITDRVDCGESGGDFSANRETIGEYLSRQSSVMYASNVNKGERGKLSFKDSKEEPTPQRAIYCAPAPFVMMPPAAAKSSPSTIKLIQYSEKAVAVIGETKPIKEKLKQLGGRFNMFLSCGAGWVFPKTKETLIKEALSL